VSRAASPSLAVPPIDQSHHPDTPGVALLLNEEHVTQLLELFFSDTAVLFPYISEHHVRSAYQALKDQRFTTITRPFLRLLCAIFAVATIVKADPRRKVSRSTEKADVFYRRAASLATADVARSPVSKQVGNLTCTPDCWLIGRIVHYLLLLFQYSQGTQRPDEGWAMHGLAVRTAMQLGLHSRSHIEDSDVLAQEVRRRVWFNCFILDRYAFQD
jgi:hypothetical protein